MIKVFDMTEAGRFHCALPKNKPGRTQLVFVEGDEQRVVEIPSEFRNDLAMRMLSANGSKVSVNMTWPNYKPSDVGCPLCSALTKEKCFKVGTDKRQSRYHDERRTEARRMTMEAQRA